MNFDWCGCSVWRFKDTLTIKQHLPRTGAQLDQHAAVARLDQAKLLGLVVIAARQLNAVCATWAVFFNHHQTGLQQSVLGHCLPGFGICDLKIWPSLELLSLGFDFPRRLPSHRKQRRIFIRVIRGFNFGVRKKLRCARILLLA